MSIPTEQQSHHEYFRPIEQLKIPDILTNLSAEFTPIIPEANKHTFESFVTPILQDTISQSYAVQSGSLKPENVTQNVILLLGEPGSGKSDTFSKLKKVLSLAGVPRNHLNFAGWDIAENAVIPSDRSQNERAALSNEEMELVNLEALREFNAMEGWVTSIAEYAPVGRDAGATCVENIIEDTKVRGLNRNIHVIGHCADPSMDFYANPNRKAGAFFNQVLYYRQLTELAVHRMYNSGQLELPKYVVKGMYGHALNKYPFKEDIKNLVDLSMERYKEENPQVKRRILEYVTENRERDATMSGSLNLASLHIMNQWLLGKGVPESNILMGKKTPNIEKFRNKPDIFDYLANFQSSNLVHSRRKSI